MYICECCQLLLGCGGCVVGVCWVGVVGESIHLLVRYILMLLRVMCLGEMGMLFLWCVCWLVHYFECSCIVLCGSCWWDG